MSNSTNPILYIFLITLILTSCNPTVSENEIYVQKLVYLKSDSSLFNGTIKIRDNASYSSKSFSNGIPSGFHCEQQNGGGFISKGKYLNYKTALSQSTLSLISNDTILIDFWQEGGDIPSDPTHLTIYILKNDGFFKSDKKIINNNIQRLANAVVGDTRNLKYNYLEIEFINAVYNWNKDYTVSYKFENNTLWKISSD